MSRKDLLNEIPIKSPYYGSEFKKLRKTEVDDDVGMGIQLLSTIEDSEKACDQIGSNSLIQKSELSMASAKGNLGEIENVRN